MNVIFRTSISNPLHFIKFIYWYPTFTIHWLIGSIDFGYEYMLLQIFCCIQSTLCMSCSILVFTMVWNIYNSFSGNNFSFTLYFQNNNTLNCTWLHLRKKLAINRNTEKSCLCIVWTFFKKIKKKKKVSWLRLSPAYVGSVNSYSYQMFCVLVIAHTCTSHSLRQTGN